MKKWVCWLLLFSFFQVSCVAENVEEVEKKGKLGVGCDQKGAYIIVDGKKCGMIGDDYTIIELSEGEHEIKVEKTSESGIWAYRGIQKFHVFPDTLAHVKIEAIREATEKRRKIVGSTIQDSQFVLIRPGEFMMGSPWDEPERGSYEKQHKVSITKPFLLQATEVTQGQWRAVMGVNPSRFERCGDDCPVENVSWNDIKKFIEKLNEMPGEKKYRLPTEAEWEYACRAGTKTPFHTGHCLSADQANYDGDHPLEGCPEGENRQKTLSVASFGPNAWGLYDMHGNVWELVEDRYGRYDTEKRENPVGPDRGESRVLRGGSWGDFARDCRSANRLRYHQSRWDSFSGFRLAALPGR